MSLDFKVSADDAHRIVTFILFNAGAGALSAWGDGTPQHSAEQGGRRLVSSLQVTNGS